MTGTCNFLAPWKNTWLSDREGPIIARPNCCNISSSTILFSSVACQSAWSGSQGQAGVSEYLNSGRTMTSQSPCLKYFFHINNHTHLDMKKTSKIGKTLQKISVTVDWMEKRRFLKSRLLGKKSPRFSWFSKSPQTNSSWLAMQQADCRCLVFSD